MKLEEVNKVIAEYMGTELWKSQFGDIFLIFNGMPEKPYTQSLDALVPSWVAYIKEKQQQLLNRPCDPLLEDVWVYFSDLIYKELRDNPELSFQEAAASATFKAIQELE